MNIRLIRPFLALVGVSLLSQVLVAQSIIEPDRTALEQLQPLIPTPESPSYPQATMNRSTPAAAPADNGHQATKSDETFQPPRGPLLTKDGQPIFGSQLFQGDFRNVSFSGFNPDYQVGTGDIVQIMLWGGIENVLHLTVDAQGNIFLPRIGPVPVLGVRNGDLNQTVNQHIRRVYKENVDAYANLMSTQTVKVFVSGYVSKPGLYQGFSSDSALYYLDRAGGIDPERGSYVNISLIRSGQKLANLNLYEFIEKGKLPITQFRDGDVILVGPLQDTVVIQGEVNNAGRFEFEEANTPLSRLLTLASPKAIGTHVSIRRAVNGSAEAIVFPREESDHYTLQPGDFVEVTTRNIPKSIMVTISGEHLGPQRVVLPYGATLSEGIAKISPSPRSKLASVQLFRRSVAERQKALLTQSLDNLERNVLNVQSSSYEEARLRVAESQLVLSFIKRAREVQPKGQVLLESVEKADQIALEDGDIIFVPAQSALVTVYGEVKFPNTQTFRPNEPLAKYIKRAGGFTHNANPSELIVIRPNGAVENVGSGRGFSVGAGDEVIVLPKPDRKGLIFAKDIMTIIYQIAVAARVAVNL